MDLKEYKQLLKIIMFDGTEIITDKPEDMVLKLLNSGVKFVKIEGTILNTSDVRRLEPYIAWGIQQAIVAEKDPRKKEVMQFWYDTRKKENKATNSLKHLLDICEAHGWTTKL